MPITKYKAIPCFAGVYYCPTCPKIVTLYIGFTENNTIPKTVKLHCPACENSWEVEMQSVSGKVL